jgi:hypothetical protein
VNPPSLKTVASTLVNFINQCNPGVFPRREITIHYLSLTLVKHVVFLRVHGLETWTRNVQYTNDVRELSHFLWVFAERLLDRLESASFVLTI